MKKELKVGDRVRFLGPISYPGGEGAFISKPCLAFIHGVQESNDGIEILSCYFSGNSDQCFQISRRQVTHVIRKKEKPKPREIWCNEYIVNGVPRLNDIQHPTKEVANHEALKSRTRCVKFREVIE
jgi:hypothetical protein